MARVLRFVLLCSSLLLTVVSPVRAAETVEAKVDFNRDIRPLLSDRCVYCHGPDKEHREGGLRLDQRKFAVAEADSGFAAIVISVLFLGGVQLITIGIMGEYVGRIFDEVKSRPVYIAYEKEGFDA